MSSELCSRRVGGGFTCFYSMTLQTVGFFLLLLLFHNFIIFFKFIPRGKVGKVGGTTLGDHCLDLACQYFGLDINKLAFQFSNLDLVLFQKFNCTFLFGTWSIFLHKREAISIQAGRRFSDLHKTKRELVFTKDGNPIDRDPDGDCHRIGDRVCNFSLRRNLSAWPSWLSG